VSADPSALPPAVDLELAGNCRARPDTARVEREVRAFLEVVEEATGRTSVLYISDDFESLYELRETLGRPLWIARFLMRPSHDGWRVWQVSAFAVIDGVDGRVDLDIMRA